MHIHEKIDLTIAAYLVHKGKVLLLHHKELDKWLPVGGHVELDEDTDEALLREIGEECGLAEKDLEFTGSRPDIKSTKFLMTPQFVDIHKISGTHRHICLEYFVKAKTDKVMLAKNEHHALRWFSASELESAELIPNVRFLAKEALRTLGSK